MNKPKLNNSEFVDYLMRFQHPLNQIIILHAIDAYVSEVLDQPKPKEWPKMISYDAWKTCCSDIKEEIDKR